MNLITLFNTPSGWQARFSGPVLDSIIMPAFGTDTIPTAFTAAADPRKVQRELQARWSECLVRVEAQ
jgi:hypothetical protein